MPRKTPEFIDRINNPQNYPYIKNKDGSDSTHRMSYGEEDGQFYVFPTIVMLPSGKLKEFSDAGEAFRYNLKAGNYIKKKTEEEAKAYAAGGYKVGTAMETYRPPASDRASFE